MERRCRLYRRVGLAGLRVQLLGLASDQPCLLRAPGGEPRSVTRDYMLAPAVCHPRREKRSLECTGRRPALVVVVAPVGPATAAQGVGKSGTQLVSTRCPATRTAGARRDQSNSGLCALAEMRTLRSGLASGEASLARVASALLPLLLLRSSTASISTCARCVPARTTWLLDLTLQLTQRPQLAPLSARLSLPARSSGWTPPGQRRSPARWRRPPHARRSRQHASTEPPTARARAVEEGAAVGVAACAEEAGARARRQRRRMAVGASTAGPTGADPTVR